MPVEQYTCWRMWCSECGHNIEDTTCQWAHTIDFQTEDEVMAYAIKQGWVFDHDTASWYCPDCQKERKEQ